jgi:hypothetical protein
LKLAEDGFRNQLRSLMNAEEISWLRNWEKWGESGET